MDARVVPTKFYGSLTSSALTATPSTWVLSGTLRVSLQQYLSRIKSEFIKLKLKRFEIITKNSTTSATHFTTQALTLKFKLPPINTENVALIEPVLEIPAISSSNIYHKVYTYISQGDEPEFVFTRDTLIGANNGSVELELSTVVLPNDTLVALSALSIVSLDVIIEASALD